MSELTTAIVWQEIQKHSFAVLGMVNKDDQARTVGVVYVVRERKLYVSTMKEAWKTRFIVLNPNISLTIPVPKGIPLMPWVKIPPATITFAASAKILEPTEAPPVVIKAIFRDLNLTAEDSLPYAVIEITPQKDFITYGIGVPLLTMRDPIKARGRVPVS